jgi:hypothetical protein
MMVACLGGHPLFPSPSSCFSLIFPDLLPILITTAK